MHFSEQPPSEQWAALKFKGETLAEVWFKPEGDPYALVFRIPARSFLIPGVGQRLTIESFLKAVGLAAEEVESYDLDGTTNSETADVDAELKHPLSPLPPGAPHLDVGIRLRAPSPPELAAPDVEAQPASIGAEPVIPAIASAASDTPDGKWQDLVARWNAILSVEASIDNLRVMLEGLQVQMETAAKKTLTTEEKIHALHADVAHWTKAKTRVHYAVPKVKEFTHRATWVMGTPERKKFEEFEENFKQDIRPDLTIAEMNKLGEQLENLLKDRQILSGQGGAVYQECKNVSSDIQASLRNLQGNAATRADRKRRAGRPKGKFFKTVRKWSGAD